MKINKSYVVIGLFFVLLFFAFSLFIKKYDIYSFDFNTTVKIQNHIPKRFDIFLSYFSVTGSFELLTILLVALIIASRKLKSVLLLVIFGAAHGIELIGKLFFNHPGPPFMFFRYDLGFYFPSSYIQTGSSYPSGHSFRAVYLSVLFIYLITQTKKLNRQQKILLISGLLLFDSIMLFSRVSLGEHWMTDVIGGTLLGVGLGILSLPVFSKN